MYNKKLNDAWLSKLRERCKGKRVLILGNSISLFDKQKKLGELIDSYDVVVRFGRGFPHEKAREYLGSKTDVWCFGNLRASSFHLWKDVPFKMLNFLQIYFYKKSPTVMDCLLVPKLFMQEDFQLYRDYFLFGSLKRQQSIVAHAFDDQQLNVEKRISQGVFTTFFFAMLTQASKVDLAGFDSMSHFVEYEWRGNLKSASSWHIPIPKDNGRFVNVHDHDSDKYVLNKLLNQNKIEIIQPNVEIDLDMELLTEITKDNTLGKITKLKYSGKI